MNEVLNIIELDELKINPYLLTFQNVLVGGAAYDEEGDSVSDITMDEASKS